MLAMEASGFSDQVTGFRRPVCLAARQGARRERYLVGVASSIPGWLRAESPYQLAGE